MHELILASLLLLCACSSWEAPNTLFPPPSSDEVPLAEWAQAMAHGTCSWMERCRDSDYEAGFVEHEACVDHFVHEYEDYVDVAAAVADGTMTWDPAAMGACLAEYARQSCVASPPRGLPCEIHIGATPIGGSCALDAHCTRDAFCQSDGATCPGTCVARSSASCDGSDRHCVEGMRCHYGVECAEVNAGGEGCTVDDFCADGYYCDITSSDLSFGSCVRYESIIVGAGGPCNGWGQVCAFGLECVPVRRRVDGTADYACAGLTSGASCIRDDEGFHPNPCPPDEFCDAPGPFLPGTCSTRHAEGITCDRDRACELGLRCDVETATCVSATRAFIGDACGDPSDCYSSVCGTANTCESATLCQL